MVAKIIAKNLLFIHKSTDYILYILSFHFVGMFLSHITPVQGLSQE